MNVLTAVLFSTRALSEMDLLLRLCPKAEVWHLIVVTSPYRETNT